jgi:hypothetical protein
MRTGKDADRRGLLARVHILADEVGLEGDLYRSCLYEWTGKESCREMSSRELGDVILRLWDLKKACGGDRKDAPPWKDGATILDSRLRGNDGQMEPERTSGKRAQPDDYPPGCSRAQWRKIRWLQRELRWDDKNLRGYIAHVAGVDHERFLDVAQAREVIAGLVKVHGYEQKSKAKEIRGRKGTRKTEGKHGAGKAR